MNEQSSEKIVIETSVGIITGDYFNNNSNKGIILFPGFTEHRSSLENIAKLLSSEFKTWIFDINSQGESAGSFDLNEMRSTVHELTRFLKNKYSLSKIGAYGNSMGGMAVGMAATEDEGDIDCLCLTSTPAGLQDVVSRYAINLMNYLPQSLLRAGTIAFDKLEVLKNDNYRRKSHAQFKGDEGYKSYAQFGALKINNIKDIAKWTSNAPRLDAVVDMIRQPTLMVYGGEDKLLGVNSGILPKSIIDMFNVLGANNINENYKELLVVEGADHSLNKKTKIDDCFNQDKEYQFVKLNILGHFSEYLL